MIQRIQSVYMFLILVINFILIISIDSNPEMSLPDSYFGYYRPYIEDYFFSEIISIVILVNIFLFKYSKIQLFNLKLIGLLMVFGVFNFFDERALSVSFQDLGLIYFISSFVLIGLSHKAINKDQAIINSSNRLR
ncbi:MAG: DUF4293 family protein [Flavobacteriaceae bacterium]|nr:DUF4293 family protein [Flavobacteriaceae bacterium]